MTRAKYDLKRECEGVNTLLRQEAIALDLGTTKSIKRLEACKGDLTAYSRWAELEFREFVRRRIQHRAGSATGLIIEGARLLDLSPATTKRYMQKLRSRRGPFSGLGDILTINPNYQPREEDDYWQDADDGVSREAGTEQEGDS